MSEHLPRRFELVRNEDYSGVSGEGVVATGVEFPDGAVFMQWRNAGNPNLETDSNGCAFKPAPDGIEATIEVHGHEGRTELRWVDEGYRFLFLAKDADEEISQGDDGYYVAFYSRNGVERAFDGYEVLDRIELPRLFDENALTQWIAESDEALELLAGSIGREAAEQIQEETRESSMYPES